MTEHTTISASQPDHKSASETGTAPAHGPGEASGRAALSFFRRNLFNSGSRRSALLQVAIGYALILVTLWTEGVAQRVLFWIAAAWFLIWAIAPSEERAVEAPARLRLRVSAIVVAAGAAQAALIVVLGWKLGTLHGLYGTGSALVHASMYLLWAIVQQFIQQMFFYARIESLSASGARAAFYTALLFGAAHIPNPLLVPVTFIGGWIMSELFRRYRIVVALGIAHGLIGLALAVGAPDAIHHHMRVGLGYLTYVRQMV